MAQEWAVSFYKSKAWEDCRFAFLQSKFGLCERCGGAASIVHHKVRLTPQNINNPDVTLNWNNLEALCQECHNEEHHSTNATADGLCFDESGDLILC